MASSDDNSSTSYNRGDQEFGLSYNCVHQPRAQLNNSSVGQNTQLESLNGIQLVG